MISKRIRGTQMWLRYPMDQHLGFLLSKEIVYEENIRNQIRPYIKPGSKIFEIGSNIGQYTLEFSELLGSNGQLIAIEPDQDNFTLLSENCRLNRCSNVTLVCKAVSNQEGETQFFKDTITGGRSGSLIVEYAANHFQGRQETVHTTTYNSLVSTYGIPDFVKVDVEGAETLIFTLTTLLHPATVFFIEVRKETASEIYLRFKQSGFKVFQIDQGCEEILDADSISGLSNLLLYKE